MPASIADLLSSFKTNHPAAFGTANASQSPAAPAAAPGATPGLAPPVTGGSNFIDSLLPGMSGLTNSATGDIQSLLSGLPSPSGARTTNAYWGAGAGTPAGGAAGAGDINSFIGARGTDLYGAEAAANRQTGIQDLLQTIGTYSSPALQAQGQANQVSQFGQNLAQQGSQFGQNLSLEQNKQAFDQAQTTKTTDPSYLDTLAGINRYATMWNTQDPMNKAPNNGRPYGVNPNATSWQTRPDGSIV